MWGDATVWGLEADVKSGLTWAGLGSDWTLSANASLLQSRMTSGPQSGQPHPRPGPIPGQPECRQAAAPQGRDVWRIHADGGGADRAQHLARQLPAETTPAPRWTCMWAVFCQRWAIGAWASTTLAMPPTAASAITPTPLGTAAMDTSATQYTPRLYLTIGTQFCQNFKPC